MSAENCGGLSKEEFNDLCMPVKADQTDEEEKKDPKKAFDLLKALCDETDGKKGSYTVGLFYLRGEVVPRNGIEAYKYFNWAVKNGNAAGLRGLRRMYDEGYIHVKEDKSEEVFKDPNDEYKNRMKGFEAMRRAAEEMNNRTAMIHLAFDYYENGIPDVVDRDLDKAIMWVKKATEGEEGARFVEGARPEVLKDLERFKREHLVEKKE